MDVKIMDNYLGKNNRVNFEDFVKLTNQVLDDIIKILYSSYGKYAGKNLIIYEGSSYAHIFTSDGKHSIKALEYSNIIQNNILDLILYIGDKVENVAKDGTTTAMLFFSIMLKKIHQEMLSNYQNPELLHQLKDEFVKTITTIKKAMKNHTIDLYDAPNKEEIIYSLAYLSSKGDKDLSNLTTELYINMPTNLYNHFSYNKSEVETEDRYILNYAKYDYELKSFVKSGREYFNTKLNSVYVGVVDLFIIPETIYDSDIEKIRQLEASIKAEVNVIIFNSYNEQLVINLKNKFPDKKIISLQYVNYITEILEMGLELNGLLKASNSFDYVIKDAGVVIDFNTIKINNLFEYKDTYINKKYENDLVFMKYIDELKSYIEKLRKSHNNNTQFILADAIRIYKNLIAPKFPTIKIGGNTIDHLESIDILEDVAGTITSSFKYGVIIDGLSKLYQCVKPIDDNSKITDIFRDTILELYAYTNEASSIILAQNAKIYDEMLERILEVLPKLILTTNVIIPGTIALQDYKK